MSDHLEIKISIWLDTGKEFSREKQAEATGAINQCCHELEDLRIGDVSYKTMLDGRPADLWTGMPS